MRSFFPPNPPASTGGWMASGESFSYGSSAFCSRKTRVRKTRRFGSASKERPTLGKEGKTRRCLNMCPKMGLQLLFDSTVLCNQESQV